MQSTMLLAATLLVFAFLAVMVMNAGREIGLRGSDDVPSPSIPTPVFITAPVPSPAPHLHVSEAHRRLKPSSTGCTGSNARLERCKNNDEIEIVKEDNGNDSIDIVSEDNGNDSIDIVESDTSQDQVLRNNKRSKQNNGKHSRGNSRQANPKPNAASQQDQRKKKKKTGNVRSWNPLNRNNNQSKNNNRKKPKKKKKSLRSRYNDFQKEKKDYKKWEKGGADAYVQKVTREHNAAYYKWENERENEQNAKRQRQPKVPQWQRTTNGHLQPRVPQVSSQEQKEREWAKMFEKQRQQDKEKAQRQEKGLKEEKARVPAKVQKMVTPARRAIIKGDALDEINALLNFKPAPQPAKVIPKRKHDVGVSLDSNSDSVDARLNGANAAGTTAGFNGEVGFDPNSQGNNPNRDSHDSYDHAFMKHQREFDESVKNGMTGGGVAGEALDYDPNAVNKDADNDLGNVNYPGTINTDQSKEVTTDFGDGTAEGVPDNDVPDN